MAYSELQEKTESEYPIYFDLAPDEIIKKQHNKMTSVFVRSNLTVVVVGFGLKIIQIDSC